MPDETTEPTAPVTVLATVPITAVSTEPSAARPPWMSEKIWLAIIGLAALVALAVVGVIRLEGYDIAGIVAALILGRAWEGAAATKAGGA